MRQAIKIGVKNRSRPRRKRELLYKSAFTFFNSLIALFPQRRESDKRFEVFTAALNYAPDTSFEFIRDAFSRDSARGLSRLIL